MTLTDRKAGRTAGLAAIVAAILCFSMSSTIVKLADTSGSVIAFWRMVLAIGVWQVILLARGGRTSLAHLRTLALPGILFGANLGVFFTAVTRTSVAHAEFIGSMTPVLLVPAGALLFGEAVRWRAMSWGLAAVVGIALVLFGGNGGGEATVVGDALVVLAMFLWATYLLLTKRARTGISTVEYMAAIVPIAALTLAPVAVMRADVTAVSAGGWWAIAFLTVTTGTIAHGAIVFAQTAVPVGTIAVMQVAQPALAVLWAAFFLDEDLRVIQVVGMVVVIGSLALFTWTSQRPTLR